MIFKFVVNKLKWLAKIPLLPHVFDAGLVLTTALFNRPRLRARELFEKAILRRNDVKFGPHRFGGIGFFVGPQEIGHLHGNGLLDLLVGKTVRDGMVANRLALPHHVLPNSGWISFWLNQPSDVGLALELFEAAYSYRRATAIR